MWKRPPDEAPLAQARKARKKKARREAELKREAEAEVAVRVLMTSLAPSYSLHTAY